MLRAALCGNADAPHMTDARSEENCELIIEAAD